MENPTTSEKSLFSLSLTVGDGLLIIVLVMVAIYGMNKIFG